MEFSRNIPQHFSSKKEFHSLVQLNTRIFNFAENAEIQTRRTDLCRRSHAASLLYSRPRKQNQQQLKKTKMLLRCPWRKSSDFNRSDFYGSPTTIQIIQRTPNPPLSNHSVWKSIKKVIFLVFFGLFLAPRFKIQIHIWKDKENDIFCKKKSIETILENFKHCAQLETRKNIENLCTKYFFVRILHF